MILDPGAATLSPTGLQRMLATILFTDIVGSTDHARATPNNDPVCPATSTPPIS
jgi:class 3 adenylate cyclase